ncbi:MAG: glycosyltransferase [Sulfuricella sp.]
MNDQQIKKGSFTEPGKTLPLVSVIVPLYNCAAYLPQALNSVFNQGYPSLEVIAVDDCSSDETVEIVKSYGDAVTLIQQDKNGGAGAARNRAMTVARGEYIAFLDGDDVWLPGKLNRQISFLETHPDFDVVFGEFYKWLPDEHGIFYQPSDLYINESMELDERFSGGIYPEMLIDSYIWIVTAVMRRSVIDKIGLFREDLRKGEDYEFWLRASRACRMAKLPGHAALYRQHPSSTTAKICDANYEYMVVKEAVEKWGYHGPDGRSADIRRVRNRLAGLCFSHGYLHFFGGKPSVAAQAFYNSLTWRFFQPKAFIYLLASLTREMFSPKNKWFVKSER